MSGGSTCPCRAARARHPIDKLQLQGFEGLSLSGAGAIGGAGSSFEARIAAPKAAPLAALSRLVLPQGAVEAPDGAARLCSSRSPSRFRRGAPRRAR